MLAARRRLRLLSTLAAVLAGGVLLVGCAGPGPLGGGDEAPADLPTPDREFRAAWIATVANIDWPSEPGLPVAEQKAELRAMLDRAAALNLNAVVFQVRPAADALYDSPHEPWSATLTGEMGRAPEPAYDPLAFAVREAHARGLELHAWFNPFRAGHPSDTSDLAPTHIARTRPELVREVGDYLWLDPGMPAARDHTHRVIMDVVRRYDVDGVHFDDYFYPYPSYNDGAPFPDSASYARARERGTTLSRNDWRRQNVNRLVRRLYRSIKDAKPHVEFGISPFGIWRPGHPPGVVGFDAYDRLYADARKWLREGWVDYFVPQLYYRLDQHGYPFSTMLRWWHEQNRRDRHLYAGLYTSRVWMEGERHWTDRQVLGQTYVSRSQPGVSGQVHFSMKALMPVPDSLLRPERPSRRDSMRRDSMRRARRMRCATAPADRPRTDSATSASADTTRAGPCAARLRREVRRLQRRVDSLTAGPPAHWADTRRLARRLQETTYAEPALVPASPWLDDEPPARPRVALQRRDDGVTVAMRPAEDDADVQWWVVRWNRAGRWSMDVVPAGTSAYPIDRPGEAAPVRAVAVSAVDRAGNEGPPAVRRRTSGPPAR